MLKKIIAVILVLSMLAGFTACGQDGGDKQGSSSESLPEEKIDTINIATGVITGQLNSAYASEEGDKLISSLIMPTLYLHDRSGRLLTDAASGKTVSFGEKTYDYKGIADIKSSYDSASNVTTFTLKLNDDARFSDGSAMTADDLIFTYYVLCDDSYDGQYSLNSSSIVGLKAYRYNNTEAPNITVTDEQIEAALNAPSDELKTFFSAQLIRPTIEEGRKFCEENWEKYVDRGYGNSAQELFVMLFPMAMDSDYSAENKTLDEIVEDTVRLFGMNYKALARIYYGDVEYLNGQAKELIEKYLYEKALSESTGSEVFYISGISRIDDRTVSVSAEGTRAALQDLICDIPVLSLAYYGDEKAYNYDTFDFGFTRGDVGEIKSYSGNPLGYGPYKVHESSAGEIILVPNEEYFCGDVPTANLKFVHVEEEYIVSGISEGEVDLGIINYDDDEIELIGQSGSKVAVSPINDDYYQYFGFNISSLPGVAPEGTAETPAERNARMGAMRNAMGILITSLRGEAIEKTVSAGAKLIDYPGSTAFWGTPDQSDDFYKTAYSTKFDGTPVQKGKELDAVKEELVAAGYTFKEDGRVQTGSRIKNVLTVAFPSYELNDSAMMELFDKFQSAMYDLGFMLKVTYFEQTDEFINALESKKYDIWVAKRSTENFELKDYYSVNGKHNYYGIASSSIESSFKAAGSNPLLAEDNYKKILSVVMSWAVEVPVYQKQAAIVYNPEKVGVDDTLDFTEFYGLFDYPAAISPKDGAKHLGE